jgi:CheY-like chemotaxis protein
MDDMVRPASKVSTPREQSEDPKVLAHEISEQLLRRAKEVAQSIKARVWEAIASTEVDHSPHEVLGEWPKQPRRPPLHVLLVLDDFDSLLSLTELLRGWGHDVSFAATATQAIADTLQYTPDVIISDFHEPANDNGTIATELAALSGILSGRRPLLIAFSELGDDGRERSQAAGFDYFYRNPLDTALLCHLLHDYAESLIMSR